MTVDSAPSSRPKVLLVAYACSPTRGSEAGSGWHLALESARRFETWVLVADNFYGEDVRRHITAHGEIPGLHFVFVPIGRRQAWLGRVPGCRHAARSLWHREAYRRAVELHRQHRFDLVHQVNFCGYREPGYLWKLDAPFVWGPVGGTQNYPAPFLLEAGPWGAVSESFRTIANRLQLRFSRRVRRAVRRASLLLTANSTGQRDFASVHGVRPLLMLETGIGSVATQPRQRDPQRREVRILWSGVFEPRKCLPLLLKALARLPEDVSCQLRILGQGPRRRAWQWLARRLGVNNRIQWLGWLPHKDLAGQYSWADMFVFTSLRDTSGNVVLEAMAAGLPIICLDHQGVHDFVTDDCGAKIPVTTPQDVVQRLAEAIVLLAGDADRWEECSAASVRQAETYLWSRQGERMAAHYRQVLGISDPLSSRPASDSQAISPSPRRENAQLPASFQPRRVPRSLKTWGKHAIAQAGVILTKVFGARADGSLGVFNYHRVAPPVPGLPEPTLNITPEQFREQIAGLQQRGYVIRSLGEVLRLHRLRLPPPPRTVVLTFDDGFASVYEHAWPILKELKAPATVFLCTAYLGSDKPFPFDPWGETFQKELPEEAWRPLRIEECRTMLASGLIDFGAHTHTHQDFRLRPDEFCEDLMDSMKVLRDTLAIEDAGFAFPFGYYNDAMMAGARRAGTRCALTLDRRLVGPQDDPFGWGRFSVEPWDTAETLAAKREGWYSRILGPYDRYQHARRRNMRSNQVASHQPAEQL